VDRSGIITVRLDTCAPSWPWKRQTPGGRGHWGSAHYAIDEPIDACDFWIVFESLSRTVAARCPPERTIFVTGEPDSIGSYNPGFLAQFHTVVTSRLDIAHTRIIRLQQGQPWFVEKGYDELATMSPIQKSRGVCAIVSDKQHTAGHLARLRFIEQLSALLGDKLEIFGRGIRDFGSKWDLLAKYRYAVVLENYEANDYLSEKLPDAWLAFCYPFYAGCRNIERYFPEIACERIETGDVSNAAQRLLACLQDEKHYDAAIPAITAARRRYLDSVQFFPNISSVLDWVGSEPASQSREIVLKPNEMFTALRNHAGFRGAARAIRRMLRG
jgi:hypothetical protein